MSAFNILEYPEFIAGAAILLVLAFGFKRSPLQAQNANVVEPSLIDDADSGLGDSYSSPAAGFYFQTPSIFRQAALSIINLTPTSYRTWVSRMLEWANRRSNTSLGEFALSKLMMALLVVPFALVLPFFLLPVIALPLYFLPDIALVNLVKSRQKVIRESLPQVLDLMVLCVDAGLGLDATVQRVVQDQSLLGNALNEELTSLSRDILLGMERSHAYQELHRRTGVDEMKMLGSALNQSTRMGLSIARILRSQSDFLRARQAQRAEERAAKLPVWISFPLWFFIMPALLFVIMGPAIITFIQHIGHVKPDWFN